MPTTQDVKSLLQGVVDGNWYRVTEVSERIAKKLAKQGHKEDAEWIKDEVAKRNMPEYVQNGNDTPWYHETRPETKLDDLIVHDNIKKQIQEILTEYSKRQFLKEHDLNNANKILLIGNAGTGKTMTAEILAHELDLPLKTVRQENLIDSKMGQTAENLDLIMPSYQRQMTFPAVYFFDEFDTLASKRITAAHASDREYNEITNVLLKEMDHLDSDSFFVAASNLADGFDPAVYRRFDTIIKFPDADLKTTRYLFERHLDLDNYQLSDDLVKRLTKFPPSVIKQIAFDVKKHCLLYDQAITDDLILQIAKTKQI